MTIKEIEEIFHAYEFNLRHGFINNADKYRDQLIAALRAGQAMRDSIGVTGHVKRDGSAMFREAHVGDSLLAIQGIESWDAAVGG